jgi:hypothetical protein
MRSFSPSVLNGKSAADIKKSIRDFASGFSGKYGSTWRWPAKTQLSHLPGANDERTSV